jgi:SpoVK/Ycf46/Vps4 family AAA+-type ATPase
MKTELCTLIIETLRLDETMVNEKLALFRDVAPSLSIYGYEEKELLELVQKSEDSSDLFEKLPVSVSFMDYCDGLAGTNEGSSIRKIVFNLVNCFCKADNEISLKEEEILRQFAAVLFDDKDEKQTLNQVEASKPAVSAPARESAQKMTDSQDIFTAMDELDKLIGLARVKSDVQQLINFTKVQRLRGEKGMVVAPVTRHIVFSGNPGTGKTTVARLIGQIYLDLGMLSKGHLVEADRSTLVAGYQGQTAINVAKIVQRAVGGILFIDEAYSLCKESNDIFGQEAVDTLLKLMEDYREDLVVVVAGYPRKMAEFIQSNPGLKSRFNKTFKFDDYTAEEMLAIFNHLAQSAGYKVATDASSCLLKILEQLYQNRDESFGNGREVRNIFETAVTNQANRLISLNDLSEEALALIRAEDIPKQNDKASSKRLAIGFRQAES